MRLVTAWQLHTKLNIQTLDYWYNALDYGRPGQNDTRGKMKQRDFSNDYAIYDVSYLNWMRILKSAIL